MASHKRLSNPPSRFSVLKAGHPHCVLLKWGAGGRLETGIQLGVSLWYLGDEQVSVTMLSALVSDKVTKKRHQQVHLVH